VIRGQLKARNITNDMGKCRLQFRNPLQRMEVFYYRQKKKQTREKWFDQSCLETGPAGFILSEVGRRRRRKRKKTE
jgi:hypothetical protein